MGKIIVFHDKDQDGNASCAIIRKKYPEAVCVGVDYDNPVPTDIIEEDDEVYIVDFTPPTEALFKTIVDRSKRVHWIDHHKTNMEKHTFYNNALDGNRVDAKPSACMLTWQYLYPDTPAPDAIEYISDYDTWEWKFGLVTKGFVWGLKGVDYGPESPIWDSLLDTEDKVSSEAEMNRIIEIGKVIIGYDKLQNKEAAESLAFECMFDGHKTLACNYTQRGSEVFDSIDKSQYEILCTFRSNGETIHVGVYSTNDDVHCGEICRKRGGGGHKGAAGFNCTDLPFTDIKRP